MILTSTTETTPFRLPWRENDPKAPVFHLRAADVIERATMEAELSGPHRAGKVWGFELAAAVRSGIESLLADDPGKDRLLEMLDAESSGEADGVSAEDAQLLTQVRAVLAEHWPDYQALVAQIERRRVIAPIVAFQRYCVGIDAPGLTFKRGVDGKVSEATLSALDPLELEVAGNRAYALQYADGQAGNSPPLSQSDDSPADLNSGEPSKAAGSSVKRTGKKTRA